MTLLCFHLYNFPFFVSVTHDKRNIAKIKTKTTTRIERDKDALKLYEQQQQQQKQ